MKKKNKILLFTDLPPLHPPSEIKIHPFNFESTVTQFNPLLPSVSMRAEINRGLTGGL